MSKKNKSQANAMDDRMVAVEKEPNLFKAAFLALKNGDWAVKCSALWMGAGYLARKQYVKALIMTLYEVAMLAFIFVVGMPYLADFGTLGTVQLEYVFNMQTMKNEMNDYDNSFTILLFSVITFVAIVILFFSWLANLRAVHKLQKRAEAGKHINSFKEDVKSYLNEKFHITLLSLPVAGVVVFTVVPLIILIAVAFTNYDQQHMPPDSLFDWVGIENFTRLFTNGLTATFGYSFKTVLTWTLIWAFFATFSNYFLGIMLAKFLLNKKTKFPKFWRTIFVVTIAVPQFVTLLLIRNFLSDSGIVNSLFAQAGITDFLKDIGLVAEHLDYVPFLSSPGWAKVMVIIINIWVGVPYQMLVATGVLLNIPADMTESAKIDGANEWHSFWKITMPYMFAVTGPTLVTDFVRNINNFNVIYLLTQDVYVTTNQSLALSKAKEIDLLVTWLFRLTQENYNYKMASVIGIMVFIICAIFTLVAFRSLTKGDKERMFQ
ncbi:MAG: sugar ABC transporter permease [Lachnospiraceae bacterium]|nr:sugar ABC transporter permease [Lachnospiraceae bacterium]